MNGSKWLNKNGSALAKRRVEYSAMLSRAWEGFKAETRIKLDGADGGLSDFTGAWSVMCEDGVKRRLTIYNGRLI